MRDLSVAMNLRPRGHNVTTHFVLMTIISLKMAIVGLCPCLGS